LEIESTLERTRKRLLATIDMTEALGMKEPEDVTRILKLSKDSEAGHMTHRRTIEVAKIIQPSITEEDLRIASSLQMAVACDFLHHLVQEGLVTIKK